MFVRYLQLSSQPIWIIRTKGRHLMRTKNRGRIMRFELVFVGKTTDKYLAEGIEKYIEKLRHYIPSDLVIIPTKASSLSEESETIMKKITSKDFIILLDEKGKKMSSVTLSNQIQMWMNQSH